ncbi:NUDIX hydrolase [Candidatus Woesearchaeota archaeon]|nr:NUDIX hydrolase [Candidatus Woesearchaeota archaeon]
MQAPLSSVDILFLSSDEHILLYRRQSEPFKGELALLGGLQQSHESFSSAIERILKQKAGLITRIEGKKIWIQDVGECSLEQVKSYDSGSDVRGGNTTLFLLQTDLRTADLKKHLSPDLELRAHNAVPKLAFDHNAFVQDYFYYFKNKTTANLSQNIAITTDIVLFTIQNQQLKVLLTKREKEPYKDFFTLPGGFIDPKLDLDSAAKSILKRDTNIDGVYLEQLYTFGDPQRDKRARVLSVAYYALLDSARVTLFHSTKYSQINWFSLHEVEKLSIAFDHKEIISLAAQRIRNKIEYTNIVFQLLPLKFTLGELQKVYEIILGRSLDKRNFRKKIADLDMLVELNEYKKEGRMRPAQYYCFKEHTRETLLNVKSWI